HKASVLVALAGIAGTPVNKSAGKATKLPPPATALMPPPRAPAKKRKMAVCRFKQRLYHDSQIAVHWKEEQYYRPPKKFIAQAKLKDPAFVKKFSEKHFPGCFDHYASLLDWDKPWRKTLDTSNPPFWKWFVGGKLNACYNCV